MNRLTENNLIKYIKRIINENDDREMNLIQKFIDKYGDFIVNFKIDGNNITFIIGGEESYKYGKKKKSFIDKFKKLIGDDYNLTFIFESTFSAEVDYEKDGKNYNVTFSKSIPNGETFELEGKLIPYGTGRGIEYELEPYDISDEEYWDENWEKIEEYILNNIPIEKNITENKSIWNWDLYHKIKGTNSIITNKLNIKKELLDENSLKELIKRVIDENNKKTSM